MTQPFIVRFTDYHPMYQTEGFFYNVLLQNVVFRSEHTLISPENRCKTYFEQCNLHGLVKTTDVIDGLLRAYAKRHLQDDEQGERLKTLLLEKNQSMEDILGSPNAAADPSHPPLPQPSAAHLPGFRSLTCLAFS